jgi:hypothetical protein
LIAELLTCAIFATVLIAGAGLGILVWNWVESLWLGDDEEN